MHGKDTGDRDSGSKRELKLLAAGQHGIEGLGADGGGVAGGRSGDGGVSGVWKVPEGPSGVCVVMAAELCGQAGSRYGPRGWCW